MLRTYTVSHLGENRRKVRAIGRHEAAVAYILQTGIGDADSVREGRHENAERDGDSLTSVMSFPVTFLPQRLWVRRPTV